ncbi:MAG: hypothetical protein M1834_007992 [Cirrosporium novae-zelandiae]|nr:MAG: hypothetical protein M1834_007992 [Cirrosporium novae-zelandiae]
MPLGRYAVQQGMPATFSQYQQPHYSHHPQQHPVSTAQLSNTSAFSSHNFIPGNSNAALSAFSTNGINGLTAGLGGGGGGYVDSGGAGLASHSAQMGFARGAAMQQQQAHENSVHNIMNGKRPGRIREVWGNNLAQEMATLRLLVEKYPYISLDVLFPGITARPMGKFVDKEEYHYQCTRCNVDMLKALKLGITLFSDDGQLPPAEGFDMPSVNAMNGGVAYPCTWQFNFQYSPAQDMAPSDFLEEQSKHTDWEMHENNGIDPFDFGALLMSSGLVLNEDVTWLSAHAAYDFGHLVKIMLCRAMPISKDEFVNLIHICFPSFYDIKYLRTDVTATQSANGSPLSQQATHVLNNCLPAAKMEEFGECLNIKRPEGTLEASTLSVHRGSVFWSMRRVLFGGEINKELYNGKLFFGTAGGARFGQSEAIPGNQSTPNMNGVTLYNGVSPSTPGAAPVGMAPQQTTPGPHPQINNSGSLTPGAGGAFGSFQYNRG